MTWTKSIIAVEGHDSDDGNFRIVQTKEGRWLLIAFAVETRDGDVWRKTFTSLDAAKDYAESM
jgi:hypothetical protein